MGALAIRFLYFSGAKGKRVNIPAPGSRDKPRACDRLSETPREKMTVTFNSLGDADNEPGKSFLFFLRDDDPGVPIQSKKGSKSMGVGTAISEIQPSRYLARRSISRRAPRLPWCPRFSFDGP